ncbi:EAL domain-containing protein [Paenibacillus alginolyticus]|uniref:EAL domain-containing protein n=1 Tax=Paenibacillus alginolyticus TaxID=59839 RepID=A0ABT4GHI6_9BACL|nr:EAL domain-containing protein [Paenibacillus alginolyticus]MCY9666563.1 EAL domain-containing protein [Paenibacillus alginolyticus]MCY9695493.1 EAL domain-containing protein [Paenibacillus alginolyticus]MEC0146630.1 EAL domain-containing protein [Paenibacillus alginolyticus]
MHLTLIDNYPIYLILLVIIISIIALYISFNNKAALKATLLESAIDCIMVFNTSGKILAFNPAAEAIFGYEREEALGLTLIDFLFEKDGQETTFLNLLFTAKDETIIGKRIELKAYRSDGSVFPAEITMTSSSYKGKHVYTACIRDLTERKKSEEIVHQLAYFDLLTGLPNRNQFNQLFHDALNNAKHYNQSLALLFLDVNRFKLINDTLGHHLGDLVLQKFSALLSESLFAQSIVSRLSGDEFVILYPLGNQKSAAVQAERIIQQLEAPFQIDGRNVFVSTSIGISLYPIDGEDPEVLLKNADQAMYMAKERGGNHYYFYEEEMSVLYSRRSACEQSLRTAIEHNELILMYQPKFHIPSGKIIGVEALLRWDNHELGSVSPKEFIPVAEESGQIIAIGKWVLQSACLQMKKWQAAGMEPVPIAVNLSAVQFHQEDLVTMILDILHQNELEAQYLELEITESISLNNSHSSMERLYALQRKGVKIAVDDFGTDYSSLSYLQKSPINTLKIGKSIVQDISTSISASSIIEAIMAMSYSLNKNVIAVGVETQEQLTFLEKIGCQHIQGYLFSVPLTAQLFETSYVIHDANASPNAL